MKISQNIKRDLKKHLLKILQDQSEHIEVTSPYHLDTADWNTIYKTFPHLKKKKVINIVDKNVLGGIVIRQASKMIDLTLTNQLKNLRNHFYENA